MSRCSVQERPGALRRGALAAPLAIATLFIGAGCSARSACEEASDGNGGLMLQSDSVSSSARAASTSDGTSFILRATVNGLPKLWQANSAILRASLDVELSLAYEEGAPGFDGRTQMPAIDVQLEGGTPNSFQPTRTSEFPGPNPSRFGTALFEPCYSNDQLGCCAYGASRCSVPITLRLQRLEGEPFPPVVVSFRARLDAAVSTCPLKDSEPALSLALEAP
jgi:hypothetical protein